MTQIHDKSFPNESKAYRKARNKLLEEEIVLRRQIERVAELRRELPPGGRIVTEYQFEEGSVDLRDNKTLKETSFSELFAVDKSSLVVYSLMYGPDAQAPCPSCTSIIDGLNGCAMHIGDRLNLVVIAKAPIEKIRSFALAKVWHNVRLLSSLNNSYNRDYFTETEDGSQIPNLNVFTKKGSNIEHFYGTELLFTASESGQEPRHVDTIWPIWNVFDLTPESRGEDWHPKLSYDD